MTEEVCNPVIDVRFSEHRDQLFTALAKARKDFGKVVKSSSNPFFKSKYADLAEILDATTNALSDNGLAVMQFPTTDISGRVVIVTVLGHSSGQWAEGRLPMPVTKNDAQGVGSAITYGRRYAFGALVSVASEADDDGNAALGKKDSGDKIDDALDRHMEKTGETRASAALVNAFRDTFEKSGKTEDQLLKVLQSRYSASRPSELTPKELGELVKWVSSQEPLEETLKTSIAVATEPKGRVLDHPVSQSPSPAQNASKGHNWAKLFAAAKERGIYESEIKGFYTKKYKVDSGTKLTPKQFSELEIEISGWNGPSITAE